MEQQRDGYDGNGRLNGNSNGNGNGWHNSDSDGRRDSNTAVVTTMDGTTLLAAIDGATARAMDGAIATVMEGAAVMQRQ